MNNTRLFSLLLLACVLLLSFAACGREEAPSAGTTAAATETVPVSETETDPPEYTDPEKDFGGQTFTVAAYQFDTSSWKLSDYCEIYAEEENGDPINDAIFRRNRMVEELLNITFDRMIIPKMSSTTEMTTAILSGDDAFKFASANGTGMPTILNAGGMLTDLNDLDADLTASWWDQQSVAEFDLYGTKYAATGDFCFYNKGAPITNFFSKKLVEDLGLEDPYQLVRDGKWTIDKMLEFSYAAARDLNGDGVMVAEEDCWGFEGEHSTVKEIVLGAGQRFSQRDADGNIEIVINTEKTANIVEKFIPFIRDKNVCIYAQDYGKSYTSAYSELMLPRFIDNCAMFYSNQLLIALNLRDMESDFGILPLPKYDEEQDEYYNTTSSSWCTFVTVPVTNPDLEMTGTVLDALGYYSQQLITPAFIEQTVLTKTMRDDDSAEMLELIFSTQSYDIANYYDWGQVRSMFSDLSAKSNTNYASAYAAIEKQIQTALEKTVAQLTEKQ